MLLMFLFNLFWNKKKTKSSKNENITKYGYVKWKMESTKQKNIVFVFLLNCIIFHFLDVLYVCMFQFHTEWYSSLLCLISISQNFRRENLLAVMFALWYANRAWEKMVMLTKKTHTKLHASYITVLYCLNFPTKFSLNLFFLLFFFIATNFILWEFTLVWSWKWY